MANQRKEYNVESTFAVADNTGMYICIPIIRLLLLQCLPICKITRNSPKIRTYSSSRSSKVVDLGVNRKLICNFLLFINSNYGRISYRFRDIDAFSSKIACFPTHPLFDAP